MVFIAYPLSNWLDWYENQAYSSVLGENLKKKNSNSWVWFLSIFSALFPPFSNPRNLLYKPLPSSLLGGEKNKIWSRYKGKNTSRYIGFFEGKTDPKVHQYYKESLGSVFPFPNVTFCCSSESLGVIGSRCSPSSLAVPVSLHFESSSRVFGDSFSLHFVG